MEIGLGFNHLRWHLLKIDVYFKYWQIIIDILVEGILICQLLVQFRDKTQNKVNIEN